MTVLDHRSRINLTFRPRREDWPFGYPLQRPGRALPRPTWRGWPEARLDPPRALQGFLGAWARHTCRDHANRSIAEFDFSQHRELRPPDQFLGCREMVTQHPCGISRGRTMEWRGIRCRTNRRRIGRNLAPVRYLPRVCCLPSLDSPVARTPRRATGSGKRDPQRVTQVTRIYNYFVVIVHAQSPCAPWGALRSLAGKRRNTQVTSARPPASCPATARCFLMEAFFRDQTRVAFPQREAKPGAYQRDGPVTAHSACEHTFD
jgi:hypothetical protein